MPVKFEAQKAEPRKLKGGGERPAYEYQGVVVEFPADPEPYDMEAFNLDVLEISGGDYKKAAGILAEGFNSLAEKDANPTKNETVKAILAVMKSIGQKPDVAKAIALAATAKEKGGLTL